MPGAKAARLGAEVRSARRVCPRKQRGLAEGRRLARLLPAFAALLLLCACSRPPCPRCNVILISIDTLRADRLGTYGYERDTSPVIDALAEKSIVYTNALSQFPRTYESHLSLFAGRYPFRRSFGPPLAELLKRAGYRTAGFTGGGWVHSTLGFSRG